MPPEESGAVPTPQATIGLPVTVSITRLVEPERIPEVTRWVQSGVNLANRYPGFLGSGWVRAHAESLEWHMLYRFADHQSLTTWEESEERRRWLDLGRDLVTESRVEKRTGIEGWFDSPQDEPATITPPRWKQAVSIWVGFFPVNLALNLVFATLFPWWATFAILPKVLLSTVILTPIMTYWVLPLATRVLRPWLLRAPASSSGAVRRAR
jgi:antibiotic biosynthesis monooxygenase (ABM) superfamily enzyme